MLFSHTVKPINMLYPRKGLYCLIFALNLSFWKFFVSTCILMDSYRLLTLSMVCALRIIRYYMHKSLPCFLHRCTAAQVVVMCGLLIIIALQLTPLYSLWFEVLWAPYDFLSCQAYWTNAHFYVWKCPLYQEMWFERIKMLKKCKMLYVT